MYVKYLPPHRASCWLARLTRTTNTHADTEHLPIDIIRSLNLIRDLRQRRETARIQMRAHMDDMLATRRGTATQHAAGGQVWNGYNGMRTLDSVSVSPREMELRLLVSECASDWKRFSREAAAEANWLEGLVRSSLSCRTGSIVTDLDRWNFTSSVSERSTAIWKKSHFLPEIQRR